MQMKQTYKEQLQLEIAQAQLQLQELEKLEQAKMKQRNPINNQLLKIANEETGSASNDNQQSGVATNDDDI